MHVCVHVCVFIKRLMIRHQLTLSIMQAGGPAEPVAEFEGQGARDLRAGGNQHPSSASRAEQIHPPSAFCPRQALSRPDEACPRQAGPTAVPSRLFQMLISPETPSHTRPEIMFNQMSGHPSLGSAKLTYKINNHSHFLLLGL